MTDLSLNESTRPADDESLAGTPTAFGDVQFDLGKWIAGVLPTRRSVPVYQRGDLLAALDDVSAQESLARGAARESLTERAREITDELVASRVVFVVEGRTSAWVTDHAAQLEKRGVKDATDILLHQLADQIIEPAGVTFDHLKALAAVSEPQVVRLVEAMTAANSSAPRIDPRFSRAS